MKKIVIVLFLMTILPIFAFAQGPTKTTSEAANFLSRGDIPGAIAVLNKGIEKRKDLYEAYKMRSFLRPMIGDYAGALDDLSKAIEIKSDEGALYEQRAFMRLQTNQDKSLILKDLDLAITHGKKIEKIYSFRATVRRQTGDVEGAIADYQTAIGLRPDLAQAHVGLASIYSLNGNDDKAVAVLENYLYGYENSLLKAQPVKGEIIAQSNIPLPPDKNKNAPDGVQTVILKRRDISRMPSSPAESEAMSDRLEQAKNTSLAYSNLAVIYKTRGDYEKALTKAAKAIELDNTDEHALVVRGMIKSAQKNYDGALEDLAAAVKLAPGSPFVYLERGITLFIMGRETEAQKDFDKYLQIYPNGKTTFAKRLAKAKETRN